VSRRRVIGLSIGWFVLSVALLVSPIYDIAGNHVEPRVVGHPWSLAYILLIVILNVGVLSVLYATRAVDWPDDGGPSE
jgi:hypothetical protein